MSRRIGRPPGFVAENRGPDLTGRVFGRWTVLGEGPKLEYRKRTILCVCECGTRKAVHRQDLIRGKSVSCGCFKRERTRQCMTTHGKRRTREYTIWCGMHRRCSSPRCVGYENYGGRGLRVCDGWRTFEAFAATMGGSNGLTIERIDNSRGYDCGSCADCASRGATLNCRWATRTEQARNKRNTIWCIKSCGTRLPLATVAASLGLNYYSLRNRIRDRGMTPNEAVRSLGGDVERVQVAA